MKRAAVAFLTVTLAALASAAPAPAAVETIVAIPGSGAPEAGQYATPVAVSRAGTEVTFQNYDVVLSPHDVVAEDTVNQVKPWCSSGSNCPIFRSAVVGAPETVPVVGTDDLEAGMYAFYCSIHPYMRGTLVVV